MENLFYKREKEKELNIVEERLETKMTLRKINVRKELSKRFVSNFSMNSSTRLLFNMKSLEIDLDQLNLDSSVLNYNFKTESTEEFINFCVELMESDNLSKVKYGVKNLNQILLSYVDLSISKKKIDDIIPNPFFSISLISKLTDVYKLYSNEINLKVNLLI